MSTTGTRGGSERAGLGARLREARERRNLSLQVVADRTKIPVTNLDALEHDQVNRLPGGIFARSFVRAYAREVGLDPEEAVREFVRMHPEHAAPDTREEEDENAIETSGQGSTGRVFVAAVVVAGLAAASAAGYWWLQGATPTTPARDEAPTRTIEHQAPAIPAANPDAETAGLTAPEPAPTPIATAAPEVLGQEEVPAEPDRAADMGADSAALPAEALPPVAASETGIRLEIHPSAPCWVRVVADGRLRLERLVLPGERPVILATDGMELQVGDAGAFAYTINGQPGRPLGPEGRVVRVAIARDTVADFVAR